jgi:Trk-type K+ transport system membrane component
MTRARRRAWRHPARLVAIGYSATVLTGTGLLMLPAAATSGESTAPITALFTATGALCGALAVVDTPTHWSTFGEIVLLALIQTGGLGIMALASLLALLVARRLGLRMQLTAQTETGTVGLGEARRVLAGIVLMSLSIEAAMSVPLAARLTIAYDQALPRAVYLGVFHAVSAYNNAGYALYSDNLAGFVTDPYMCVPIMIAMVAGGIGFPVLFELASRLRGRHRRWTLHTKMTLLTYGGLLLLGAIAITMLEWRNDATMGQLAPRHRLLAGLFHAITPRTTGFNTLDVSQFHPATLLVNDVLMFIGGGSASTAGGIKVTTFALLGFVILAEIRGEPTVHVMGRRLTAEVQRQALTVALLGVGVVVAAVIALLAMTDRRLDDVLFESVSAFGTVGLSTGLSAQLPAAGQLILVALMSIGRIGPITLASALALRERLRRYELPEERPVVG